MLLFVIFFCYYPGEPHIAAATRPCTYMLYSLYEFSHIELLVIRQIMAGNEGVLQQVTLGGSSNEQQTGCQCWHVKVSK